MARHICGPQIRKAADRRKDSSVGRIVDCLPDGRYAVSKGLTYSESAEFECGNKFLPVALPSMKLMA